MKTRKGMIVDNPPGYWVVEAVVDGKTKDHWLRDDEIHCPNPRKIAIGMKGDLQYHPTDCTETISAWIFVPNTPNDC
jgi:hypothetical protein